MEQPVSQFKSKGGLRRIADASRNSVDGFRAAWETEHAFRQEVFVVGIGIVIALLLPVSAFQKVFLIAVLVFVVIVELLNSAIEAIVDRISLERNPLSKKAKDIGSAAVALAIGIAAMSWIVVLFNRFY
jgi:diacylglycerol kinase (ATP)